MPIQPLASAFAATPQAQLAQSAHRAAQIRREQNRLKVSSIDQDTLERQVESTDAVEGVHDRPEGESSQEKHPRKKPEPHPDADEPPHIDLTA